MKSRATAKFELKTCSYTYADPSKRFRFVERCIAELNRGENVDHLGMKIGRMLLVRSRWKGVKLRIYEITLERVDPFLERSLWHTGAPYYLKIQGTSSVDRALKDVDTPFVRTNGLRLLKDNPK
ncbi:hypothetical protein HZH66_007780 [Vespula vulgaris]|uniref:Uncharacterized protein n=1 Tax=Vespula vulgaris TaxID=7454 RepID=A0A834JZU1_VESVU|nr:hypothetical protein HZH66_007780 [Vespula vulgaris]